MVRTAIYLLLLSCLALAQPIRQSGYLRSLPQQVPLSGRIFRGQARLETVTDLRDCRQFRVVVDLTNQSQAKGYFSVYLVLLDKSGKMLGSGGFHQSIAREGGKIINHEMDLTMPVADLARVASYQIVLYEDTQPIGVR